MPARRHHPVALPQVPPADLRAAGRAGPRGAHAANAVENGAVAHAYVFAGPRGTGKTSTARILAKALNCVGHGRRARSPAPRATPCGVCRLCASIAAGASLDVIEMDAASQPQHRRRARPARHGRLRPRRAAASRSTSSTRSTCSPREAFNALLKTLEEPPANVVFVLATTEPHKMPETIVSRCQRFDFRRPHVHDAASSSSLAREIARPTRAWTPDEPEPPWQRSPATRRAASATPSAPWTSSLTFSDGQRSRPPTCSTRSA